MLSRFLVLLLILLGLTGTARSYEVAGLTWNYTAATDVPASGPDITLSGVATLTLGYAPVPGSTLTVLLNTGQTPINGRFSNLAQGQMVNLPYGGSLYPFLVNYYGGNGNDLILQWGWRKAVAWGGNESGQTAVPAAAQSGIIAISAGSQHIAALRSDGSVIAWGSNTNGQTTVPAGAQSGVIAVAAGVQHTMAMKSDGSMFMWGMKNCSLSSVPAAAQTGIVAIDSGLNHALALKSGGSVLAWGCGGSGETIVPAAAQTGVTAIASGASYAVALKSDGSVIAWGANSRGQTVVPAAAQSGVVAIAAGSDHTVALKNDGSVLAWGDHRSGQTTVPAAAQSGVIGIAAGRYHTLALKSDGSVLGWGDNSSGQVMIPAEAQSGVMGIAAAENHSVAMVSISPTPEIALRGYAPDIGHLAYVSDGDTSPSREKHSDFGIAPVTGGTVTRSFALENIGPGQLDLTGTPKVVVSGAHAADFNVTIQPASSVAGMGSTTFSVTFDPSDSGLRYAILSIASSDSDESVFDFAIQGTGSEISVNGLTWRYAAGTDVPAAGAVPMLTGTATLTLDYSPLPGTSLTVVQNTGLEPSSGRFSNLAQGHIVNLTYRGNAYPFLVNYYGGSGNDLVLQWAWNKVIAWGGNSNGQTTIPPGALSGVVAIAAGKNHMVALQGEGKVLGWGQNDSGQTTVPAEAQSDVIAIAAGCVHTVALKKDGSVLAWGSNSFGQTMVPAEAQSGVIAIAAGDYHTVALKNDSSVLAWGWDMYGQTTVPPGAQIGVKAIATGHHHSVALKSDGSVLAWGQSSYGKTTVPSTAQSGVIGITAGLNHTLALKSDGSVVAWGYNGQGQTTVPTGAKSGVKAIAAGWYHSVALRSDGSVLAWGYSANGQTTVPTDAQGSVIAIAANQLYSAAIVPVPAPPGINYTGTNYGNIPDNDSAGRDIFFEVSGLPGVVRNVSTQFSFSPAHTRQSDLRIELVAPDGRSAWIYEPSEARPNDVDGPYIVSDAGNVSLQTASSGLVDAVSLSTGTYRAASGETLVSLNLTFAGSDPNGIWRLRFHDTGSGQIGSISDASLRLATASPGNPGITVMPDGSRQVTLTDGDPVTGYLLRGSSDLITWTTLQTLNTSTTGAADSTDAFERGPRYYYRIIPAP